jgi:hypothetical protein
VLAGSADRGRQRTFVERFLRPNGINRPVSPLVASTIVALTEPAGQVVAELA